MQLRYLFAGALLLSACVIDPLNPFPGVDAGTSPVGGGDDGNGSGNNNGGGDGDGDTTSPGDGDGDTTSPGDIDAGAGLPGDGDGDGDGDVGDGDTGSPGDGDGDTGSPGDGDGDTGSPGNGGGDAGSPGNGGGSSPFGPDPSKLPKVNGPCPEFKNGTVSVGGARVVLTVGSKPGPVYLYFHGTGTTPSEVDLAIPGATRAVRTDGGFVASWQSSNNRGITTGTIWYTGDMEAADQLIACGLQQGLVDPSRIHVSGYSAGGLETGAFIYTRSHYVASAIVYSGGKPLSVLGSLKGDTIPSVVGAAGAPGADWLALDFGSMTPALTKEVVKAGGFAIDCNDGSIHIDITRLGVGGKALEFFRDHPYGVKAYQNGLPSGWPRHCKITQ
jgi:hypothetical protein